MKSIIYYSFVAFTLAVLLHSCGVKTNGELVGIYSKGDKEPDPYGMVYVPRGTFVMGPNDQDVSWAFNTQNKTVDVESFWIDDTEITNAEYKQFVFWVKDSLMRLEAYRTMEGDYESFVQINEDTGDTIYNDDENKNPRLNPKRRITKRDKEIKAHIDTTFYYKQGGTQGRQIKTYKLIYTYYWVDYGQASKEKAKLNPLTGEYDNSVKVRKDVSIMKKTGNNSVQIQNQTTHVNLKSRKDFVMQRMINIYPDTLCWMRYFSNAYNEPYMKLYFSHPSYSDYPVVGVTWEQASAFCHWRTKYKNTYLVRKGKPTISEYRLPMESEWEYAARGGRKGAMYPWGGPYTRRADGCFLANFKPNKGQFSEDGYLIPSSVGEYPPNDYNIFDMAGNVAEWTSSAYSESSMTVINTMNPNFQYNARQDDPKIMKRKVVKGGSWKDVAYFLQCGVSTYEYQDEARPYIGFRCVRSMIGPRF